MRGVTCTREFRFNRARTIRHTCSFLSPGFVIRLSPFSLAPTALPIGHCRRLLFSFSLSMTRKIGARCMLHGRDHLRLARAILVVYNRGRKSCLLFFLKREFSRYVLIDGIIYFPVGEFSYIGRDRCVFNVQSYRDRVHTRESYAKV